MNRYRFALSLVVTFCATFAPAQSLPPLVAHAIRHVEKNPTLERRIGLAELQRAHGHSQAGLATLEEAARSLPPDDPRAASVQELLCWRSLPVAPAHYHTIDRHVASLKALQPANAWVPVWERYLAASRSNRTAIADIPASLSQPARFPTALAEKAHLELLKELGLSRLQAGVEVIAARTYEPLHALRSLDRALTREADFLQHSQRDEDAKRVVAFRDRLRKAYLHAAQHVVERLFALHLAGDAEARDALVVKAKGLPYLHHRPHLAGVLHRLDDEQAWKLLIEPLLASELTLIDNPPDLARQQAHNVAELHIAARKKTVEGATARYEGDVQLRFHGLAVSCDTLTILQNADPAAVVLNGAERVRLHGLSDYPGGVTADRITYDADSGAFMLGGDIRLHAHGKVVKLRSCSLTRQGTIRDAQSWLDDFQKVFTIDGKLQLLPKITSVYADEELPDEVRYLLALNLLRPHLTWHAPYLPPLPGLVKLRELVKRVERLDPDMETTWREALGGEAWMLGDVPAAVEHEYRTALKAWYAKYNQDRPQPPDIPIPNKELCFWRLRDPRHADVARAARLLQGVGGESLRGKARRWLEEIRRNNTVLTFDIAGGAPRGKAHALLMDVRNAENVSFKLYRVQRPEELAHAAKHIGRDFIFRNHEFDGDQRAWLLEKVSRQEAHREKLQFKRTEKEFEPAWTRDQLVQEWNVRVADLPFHPSDRESRRYRRWHDDRWSNEADARYFDDECTEHRRRIDKEYRPHVEDFALSSWQCDRVVTIPGKALNEAGAYVLIAESNGQAARVPIVVEPLSLTLRRCRDGVFALVSNADGMTPLEGAKVLPAPMRYHRDEAITDKEGVAFARFLAHGDLPIIAHHQGRYAIGGFGQVFEGIYETPEHEFHWARDRLQRARMADAKEVSGQEYADRHVVVAYTDRPTYRPGQEVNFKLIVRKLIGDTNAGKNRLAGIFRGDEFDARTKMVVPDLDPVVVYSVHDPKGHVAAHGSLKLSDFGTAAGKLALNSESVVGAYTFKVTIAGQARIVPEVFAVKHYRRPNFEIDVAGLPKVLMKPQTLTLIVSSRYYFGPPVANGTVEVRVVRRDLGAAATQARSSLDEKGQGKIELRLPRDMQAGKYVVVCSVTDESGRTVSTTSPLTLATPEPPKGTTGLDMLPRFVAANHELKVATTVKEITARQDLTDLRFPVKAGVATLKFTRPGWYRLQAGDDEELLFVYGNAVHPETYEQHRRGDRDLQPDSTRPRWVNLSDFALEDHEHLSRWENPDQHLFALFDRQTLKPGDSIRMLVYVPHQRAKLLFTIEGRTILDYAVVWTREKAGAYQIIEIPVKKRYFPNVYVQGRIVAHVANPADRAKPDQKAMKELEKRADDDGERDPRWCRIDVVKPADKLDPGALHVQIDTDAANYRPGDVVRATVKVTDRDGKPQAAELSLAAIDESVFAFGEDALDGLPSFFHAPYETRRFYPKPWRTSLGRRWNVAGMQAQKDALQALQKAVQEQGVAKAATAEKMLDSVADLRGQALTAAPLPRLGGDMPAGQIPLARLREHFHETAAWEPQLRTDASGVARVAITLPDSLTRYRLTSVALTKTTEIGVGRARITAGLPLAVQVFLPRFAVEKDRILAVALVHNHSKEVRDCQLAWEIAGASVDGPSPAPTDWKLVNENGKFVGTGRVKVAAGNSAKVGLWLRLDQIGTAKVVFRTSDATDADAEACTLPVQPLGRSAEINANEQLAIVKQPAAKEVGGKFHRDGRVQLPAGFMASELHVSLTASELAQALDGLDYLIDYPYGCVEQTMSRFLPAVMVMHATQQAPIRLDPEVARKLPDVLAKGLTRLYGHQHADGSWGWFEKDSRNLEMSAYVVYGLARCQATGTNVDQAVLKRGCDYLLEELRTNRHEVDAAARAWYAVALAGHADRTALAALAKQEASSASWRPEAWCRLALACRAAGLNEIGEQLWIRVSTKTGHWLGHDTETISLRLKTQLAFGARYADCRDSAMRVLSRRSGTRWNHTRDTSWAIEALSDMLGYAADKATVRRIEITLAGKTILEVKDQAELKKLTWRLRLSAEQLPAQEGLEIRLKADTDEPIYVAVSAVGVQRQDVVLASGKRIQLNRTVETLDGKPVQGPLKVGEVVKVRLRLDLQQAESYLLIEERRPALCEFAHDRIAGNASASAVHQEFRDDRLCVFFRSLPSGTHEIVYYLRAETPGTCSVLPGCAYPMYDEKQRGETASSRIEVKTP